MTAKPSAASWPVFWKLTVYRSVSPGWVGPPGWVRLVTVLSGTDDRRVELGRERDDTGVIGLRRGRQLDRRAGRAVGEDAICVEEVGVESELVRVIRSPTADVGPEAADRAVEVVLRRIGDVRNHSAIEGHRVAIAPTVAFGGNRPQRGLHRPRRGRGEPIYRIVFGVGGTGLSPSKTDRLRGGCVASPYATTSAQPPYCPPPVTTFTFAVV